MRITLTVEVNTDPVPGTFHTPNDAANAVERMLRDMVPHYRPKVTPGRPIKRSDLSFGNERYARKGTVVYCAYWRECYTVLSINDDRTVTVRWEGSTVENREPRVTTHMTAVDIDRDRIVGPVI